MGSVLVSFIPLIIGFIFRGSSQAEADAQGESLIVSTVLLVIGILTWITAIKQWV